MVYSTIAVSGNVVVSTWKLDGNVKIGERVPIPPYYVDTSDATGNSASQILRPYSFYSNGVKYTGTAVLATARVSGVTLYLTNGFPVSV